MTIDLNADRLTLHQVANLVDVHISTVWHWTLKGVRGRKLESFPIGGRRYVAREELDKFVAAQNAGPPNNPSRSATQHAIDEKLNGLGI